MGATLKQKTILLVSVILLLELMFLLSLGKLVQQSRDEAVKEAATKAIAAKTFDIFSDVSRSMAIVASHTDIGPTRALEELRKESVLLKESMKELSRQVKEYPEYANRVDRILRVMLSGIRAAEVAGRFMEQNNVGALASFSEEFKRHDFELKLWNEIELLLQEHESRLSKVDETQRRNRMFMECVLALGVLANIVLAVLVGRFFIGTIANRIGHLSENTVRLAAGQTLLPAMPEHDEIGKLDGSFREMALVLEEAAKKERAIIDNSSDVMCSLNEQAQFEKVSPASRHLWGYSPEELMNRSLPDLVIPEDQKPALQALSALKSGTLTEFETRMRKADGTLVYMLCSGRWSDIDVKLFLVAHDITTRKLAQELLTASERRVRAMLDNMLVGLVSVTTNGKIELLNSRIIEMLGYAPHELVDTELLPLFPRTKSASFLEFWQQIANAESGKICEVEAQRKDGSLLPVEISMTEFSTIDGERIMVNLVDITQRRQIERMKEEFVAMISHDLRTPLNSVNGFLELLEDGVYGDLSATGTERTALATRNVARLLRLINDLLEVTKLESGQLELHYESISSKTAITRSIESVRDFADKQRVSLEQRGEDHSLVADGHRIERVIVNLLSNAVKFSPEGAAVTVEAVDVAIGDDATTPGSMVEFRVIDRGRGVPESHREVIFERYRQVKVSDATRKGGTGLGLAICKAIVEQHGGQIGIDSEEGKGSTFWFRLPRERKQA